ncbi:MAG: replication initiation protein RepC, partial [Pseudomonadota bacterium]
ALLTMMRETRPSDWTDPCKEPVCFAMQVNIAATLGKTGRSIRRDEEALIRLGFIDKRVAGNGWRCRVAFADGTEFHQGLSFTPLIERVPELLALREQVRFERQHAMRLRRQCSALKRHVKERLMALQPQLPDNADLRTLADRFLSWPVRYDVFTSLDALEAHHVEMLETSETLDEMWVSYQLRTDMSAKADVRVRHYIQDTTQDPSVSCNASVHKRTGGKPPDSDLMFAATNGATTHCLRNKHDAATAEHNSQFLDNLHPYRLLALCSEEMRLHIARYQEGRAAPRMMDFVLASIDRVPELGINRSAYEAGVHQMGDVATALCILIIDRNRHHPVTPVRNPGGVLRAMTKRHAQGQLNLTGSLIGLFERDKDG